MRQKSSSSVRVFYPDHNREEIIKGIRKALDVLQHILPLELVVLFGSYAKGNYTVASDIDLLVVYRGEKREDVYALCKKMITIPRLEPHVYSKKEYEEMRGTVDKMIKDGVVILTA